MQMNAIDTFLTIAATGSFHAAAEVLNITQTTVSARIKVLERELSISLFERGPAGTRLSAAGQQFRPYAEQLQQTWRFVRSGGVAALQERISLRMGAQLSMWDGLLVDLAIWLEEQKGKLPFTLNYDHALNMAEAVAQQLLDLAITSEVPHGTRLRVAELPPERLLLVSHQRYSLAEVQDPKRQPLFVNLDFGRQYAQNLQAVLPKDRQQHIVLGNAAMGLRYLKMRGGMGYFPEGMVADALDSAALMEVSGAPEILLDCKALYHPETPVLAQIEEALEGLQQLRSPMSQPCPP